MATPAASMGLLAQQQKSRDARRDAAQAAAAAAAPKSLSQLIV
jgi:hypothetical protein